MHLYIPLLPPIGLGKAKYRFYLLDLAKRYKDYTLLLCPVDFTGGYFNCYP